MNLIPPNRQWTESLRSLHPELIPRAVPSSFRIPESLVWSKGMNFYTQSVGIIVPYTVMLSGSKAASSGPLPLLSFVIFWHFPRTHPMTRAVMHQCRGTQSHSLPKAPCYNTNTELSRYSLPTIHFHPWKNSRIHRNIGRIHSRGFI